MLTAFVGGRALYPGPRSWFSQMEAGLNYLLTCNRTPSLLKRTNQKMHDLGMHPIGKLLEVPRGPSGALETTHRSKNVPSTLMTTCERADPSCHIANATFDKCSSKHNTETDTQLSASGRASSGLGILVAAGADFCPATAAEQRQTPAGG